MNNTDFDCMNAKRDGLIRLDNVHPNLIESGRPNMTYSNFRGSLFLIQAIK